jgi:hypothetical protein
MCGYRRPITASDHPFFPAPVVPVPLGDLMLFHFAPGVAFPKGMGTREDAIEV